MILSTKKIAYPFLFLFGVLLFVYGSGRNNFYYLIWGFLLVSAFLIFYSLIKKIKYPKYFLEYKIFLIIAALSLGWSTEPERSLYYLILFVIAGLVWLVFYNAYFLGEGLQKIIIILGLLLLGLYLLDLAMGYNSVNSLSLYLPLTPARNHNHLGDFWVLIILITGNELIRKNKNKGYIFLTSLGFYAFAVSQSRSAYLALGVGFFYLLKDRINIKNSKLYLLLTGVGILVLFLYAGLQKTILFSRPYIGDVARQLMENPYGNGLGNFAIISRISQKTTGTYSAYTHNIFLEMISGLGVYSLAFIYWFYKIVKVFFWNSSKSNIYIVLFLAMTVNFLFDYTYFLPAMLFLWLAFLGLAQSKQSETNV